MKMFLNQIKETPIGSIVTSLGFLTLAEVWTLHGLYFLKPLAIVFSLTALSMMVLKISLHPDQVWTELKHPLLGAFYTSIDMTTFILASNLLPFNALIAKSLWLIGVITHFSLLVLFFSLRAKDFTFKSILPSWNVVLVGVSVANVSGNFMGFPHISSFITWFEIILYLPFYPILLYRIYVYIPKIEEAHSITIGILAAPSSLVLASYLTISETPIDWIIAYLAISSIINVIIVYIELPKYMKKGFNPGFSAFTFPLAISIVAMNKMKLLFSNTNPILSFFFKIIENVELLIGSCVIIFVVINYGILLIKLLTKTEKEEDENNSLSLKSEELIQNAVKI